MAAWDSQSASPAVKYEPSPAESFLSLPGEMYPPLFGSASTSETMNPLEIMTPRSLQDAKTDVSVLETLAAGETQPSTPGPSPTSEKKPAKKRKSWGQVLPEPKTNLPPRKRAKTEDEKEQRRVERVLRNRRAAQSSRERKRLEVEALEQRNQELEAMLLNAQKTNLMLCQELSKMKGATGVVPHAPLALSLELFSSQDGHSNLRDAETKPSLGELMMTSQAQTTINPTSLSPALTPVPDAGFEEDADDIQTAALPADEEALAPETSPDMTQHPAEMLCPDLLCQSAEVSRSWAASRQPLAPSLALYCQLTLLLTCTSTLLSLCQRPLMQIAMSLKKGFSLPPSPALLNTIVWLVTTPSPSTSTTSSTTRRTSRLAAASRPSRPSTTLRLKLLRKILTCSPMLARPLTDATMAALRLVRSEETLGVGRVLEGRVSEATPSTVTCPPDGEWLSGAALPSREMLLTLLWALKVEGRRAAARADETKATSLGPSRQSGVLRRVPAADSHKQQKFVLHVQLKRKWDEMTERPLRHVGMASGKRRRSG